MREQDFAVFPVADLKVCEDRGYDKADGSQDGQRLFPQGPFAQMICGPPSEGHEGTDQRDVGIPV